MSIKKKIMRIKAMFNAGYSCTEIAKKLNLNECIVRIIVNKRK